jgi:hypothetical protein
MAYPKLPLYFLIFVTESVIGQSTMTGGDTPSRMNTEYPVSLPSLSYTASPLLATKASQEVRSKVGEKQTMRLLQEYIRQLIRDKPEIVGCMEG